MIRGAEAIVTFEGDVVRKRRVPKGYRHERIDARLITQRVRTEANVLERLAGIPGIPKLISVEGNDLHIERIEAEPYAGQAVAAQLAQLIFAMHERSVAHADITPKNVLVADRVSLIDYGLAGFTDRMEDRAYDLAMTRETFSSYPRFADELIEAYRALLADPRSFDERLAKIESRGRNKRKGL